MGLISSSSNKINISGNFNISDFNNAVKGKVENNIIQARDISTETGIETYDFSEENTKQNMTISVKKIEEMIKYFDKTIQTDEQKILELRSMAAISLTDEQMEEYLKKYPLINYDPRENMAVRLKNKIYSPEEINMIKHSSLDDYNDIPDVDIEEYSKQYYAFFKDFNGITYEEYEQQIATYEADILKLKSSKYAMEQLKKELPYLQKTETDAFIEYKNANQENIDKIFNGYRYESETFVNASGPGGLSVGQYNETETITTDKLSGIGDYLTEEQKLIYCYLYSKEGTESASAYLTAIEDKINQAKGAAEAEAFINSLKDENGNIDVDFETVSKTVLEGFGSGITTFGEGIENLFSSEGMISANQYESMYILEALSDKGILDNAYEISSSIGNMAIPIAITAILTIVCPAAGASLGTVMGEEISVASIVGQVAMGASAAGNAKNQALVQGNDRASSILYGLMNGLSETTLGLFLGNIPGLNKGSLLSLKGILKEGVEEGLQTFVDAGAQYIALGEEIDLSQLTDDAKKAFIYGMITSGIMNGGKFGLTITCNGVKSVINTMEDLINFRNGINDTTVTVNDSSTKSFEEVIDYYSKGNAKLIEENDIAYAEKLKKTYNLDDGDIGVINSILVASKNHDISPELQNMLSNFDKLNQLLGIKIQVDPKKSYYWAPFKYISIEEELFNYNEKAFSMTFFHETGHALLHTILGKGDFQDVNITEEQAKILENARNRLTTNSVEAREALTYSNNGLEANHKLTTELYESISAREADKVIATINSLYEESNSTEISNVISNGLKIDSIKDYLVNAGINTEDITSLLDNKELVTDIAIRQNALEIKTKFANMLSMIYNEFGDQRKISSMLNSICQTEDIIVDDGTKMTCTHGHSNEYWNKNNNSSSLSYDELFADFFSLKVNGRDDALMRFRKIAGEELYMDLENTLNTILNTVNEKMEEYNG